MYITDEFKHQTSFGTSDGSKPILGPLGHIHPGCLTEILDDLGVVINPKKSTVTIFQDEKQSMPLDRFKAGDPVCGYHIVGSYRPQNHSKDNLSLHIESYVTGKSNHAGAVGGGVSIDTGIDGRIEFTGTYSAGSIVDKIRKQIEALPKPRTGPIVRIQRVHC
jgi:hypothetical protein